ncbi:MAG TPA: hypothetical protein VGG33_01390, partial [Polyangia bacterium]
MRITSSQVAMTATHEVSVSVVRQERLVVSRDVEDAERPRRRGDDVRGHRHGHHLGHHDDHRDHDRTRGEVSERRRADFEAFERLAVELMAIFRRGRDEGLAARGEGNRWAGRGVDVVYDRHEERREVERAAFAAAGTVTTADGRTIDFSTAFAQLRSEVSTSDVHVELPGPVLPPLGADAATGTEAPAADGPVLSPSTPPMRASRLFLGGGYLTISDPVSEPVANPAAAGASAVDDDGPASDTTEESAAGLPARDADARWLGGVSGDAFRDLALLDSDHNGWIDEAAPAWGLLRLVQPTAGATPEGGDSLADAGIGA